MAVRYTGFPFIIMFAALLGLPGAAAAQPDSPAAMRQRIAELEDRVDELLAQIDELRTERDELRGRIRELLDAADNNAAPQSEGSAPSPGGKPSAPPASDGEVDVPISALSQDPLASPDALYIAMVLDYRETMTAEEDAPPVPTADSVSDWIKQARQEFEGPTTWLIRIDSIIPPHEDPDGDDDRGPAIRYTVLDGTTAEPISRPALLEIPDRFAGRFPRTMPEGAVLYGRMRVRVEAEPVFQPGRTEPGPFNFPSFVGPHAGFGYSVRIIGLKYIEPQEIDLMKNRPEGPVDR